MKRSRDVQGTMQLVSRLEIMTTRYTQLASKLRDLKFGIIQSLNMLQEPTRELESKYNVEKVVVKLSADIVPELVVYGLADLDLVDDYSICAKELNITPPTREDLPNRYSTDLPKYHVNLTYYQVSKK